MEALRRSLRRRKTDNVKTVSSRVALHGVADVVESPSLPVQLFWMSLIVVSAVAVTYGVFRNVMDYIYSPLMTSYSLKTGMSMKFPDVYICPMNPVHREKLPHNNEQKEMIKNFLNPDDEVTLLGLKTRIWDPTDKKLKRPPEDKMETSEHFSNHLPLLFRQVSFTVDEFFKECMFQQVRMNCSDISTRLFDKDYGICYLIQPNLNQTAAGAGLQLVVDLHSDLSSAKPFLNGVGITIADQFDPTATTARQLFASVGGLTKVSLEATLMKLINFSSPHSSYEQRCRADGHFEVLHNLSYTKSACNMDCVQIEVNAHCNCSLPIDDGWLKPKYSTLCKLEKIRECRNEALEMHNGTLVECRTHCLMPCQYWSYTHSVSYIGFNEVEKEPQLNPVLLHLPGRKPKPEYYERLNEDIIIIDIAFGEIQHTELYQSQSMTLETFVSNVGGQMGLWLGASIVSVVQILCVFAFCCYQGVKTPIKKTKERKAENKIEKNKQFLTPDIIEPESGGNTVENINKI